MPQTRPRRSDIEAFFKGDMRVAPDPAHSQQEDGFIAVGRIANGRPVFVAFTYRLEDRRRLIRPISACHMHKKEIEAYEKEGS
jgi:uncharacterized DUF497 family protein